MAEFDDIDNTNLDDEGDSEAVNPSDLASSIRAGQQAIHKGIASGAPGTPLDERDSKYYLGELEKLANDPRYQSATPSSSRESLRDALAQAKQLYKDQADRNDWYQVAQTLGRAVTQFGAATAGLHTGHNMASLDMGPPIDYEQRNQRALGEYKQDVANATLEDRLNRQDELDRQRALDDEYKKRSGALSAGLGAALRGETLESQENRADARNRTLAARQDALEARRAKREDERANKDDLRSRMLQQRQQLHDLDQEEKTLAGQIQAGRTLANEMGQEEDLGSKDYKKMQEKFGGLAAKADVDLQSAMNDYNKNAPKRNRKVLGIDIPGTETVDTEQARPALYDALGLSDKIKKLQDIRAKKQALIGNTSGGPASDTTQPSTPSTASTQPAPSAPPPSPSTPGGRVKVRAPNGTVGTIPAEQVQQALSQGYTVVQ